jgi:hypothetical protein
MREKGKRGNRRGGLVWKREKGRGFLAKWPSSSPGLHPEQRQGVLRRRRPPGLPATTADGERGKRRRATRGFFSHPHLGLGCAMEADRGRRRTAGWGSSGGGAVDCNGGGEMACAGAG